MRDRHFVSQVFMLRRVKMISALIDDIARYRDVINKLKTLPEFQKILEENEEIALDVLRLHSSKFQEFCKDKSYLEDLRRGFFIDE